MGGRAEPRKCAAADQRNARKKAWQNDSIANLEQSLAHATSASNNSSQSIVTLVANNDRLAQINFALQEELKQLRETREKPNNVETYGKPPDFSFAMIKAIQDAEKMKSKAVRAVVELLPEQESETDTATRDHELIAKIANEMKIEKSLQTSAVKRHGPKRDGRPRIIKVQFSSTSTQDHFIRNFRNTVRNHPEMPQKVRVRRDMIESELAKLRDLRNQCYELNHKENLFRWYVKDLEIVEMRDPKPFNVKKNDNSSRNGTEKK